MQTLRNLVVCVRDAVFMAGLNNVLNKFEQLFKDKDHKTSLCEQLTFSCLS